MGSALFAHRSQLILWLQVIFPPVVVLALAAAAKRTRSRESPPFDGSQFQPALIRLAFSGGIVLALFIASLPKAPPFSAGQKLGLGILLGGISAALGALFDVCSRSWMRTKDDLVRGFSPTALVVLTYFAIITTLFASGFLLQRDDPLEMFIGIGVGALIVAFLHLIPQKVAAAESEDDGNLYELFICVTVAVASATLLAALHYRYGLPAKGTQQIDRRLVWQIPMLLGSIPFWMPLIAGLIGILLRSFSPTARGITIIALAFVKLCVSYPHFSVSLYGNKASVIPIIAGAIAGALIIWLVVRQSSASGGSANVRWLSSVESASVLSLLVFVCVFLCFRSQAGYGVALTAVSIAAMALCSLPLVAAKHGSLVSIARTVRLLTRVLSVIVSFVLLRAMLEVADLTEAEISLYTHFVLFGLMSGCVLPFVLDAVRRVASEIISAPRGATGALTAMVLGAGCAVVAPALFLLWGIKAVAGLFTGLLLCQTVLLFVEMATEENPAWTRHAISLISWGIAFPALKIIPLLEPHDSLVTRREKIFAVVVLAIAFFLWSLVNSLVRSKQAASAGRAHEEGK